MMKPRFLGAAAAASGTCNAARAFAGSDLESAACVSEKAASDPNSGVNGMWECGDWGRGVYDLPSTLTRNSA